MTTFQHYSTKTYGAEVGLSCAFRQWRATHSHCRFLHGYAISVTLTFGANELDYRNWVVDFGGLGPVKEWLKETFDHKTLVAADDPCLPEFQRADGAYLLDLEVLPEGVGCELFAKLIFDNASPIIRQIAPHATLVSVEVREHGANSALYTNPYLNEELNS